MLQGVGSILMKHPRINFELLFDNAKSPQYMSNVPRWGERFALSSLPLWLHLCPGRGDGGGMRTLIGAQ